MNLVMKFTNPDGEVFTFEPESFIPLTCQDFLAAHNAGNNLYEIKVNAIDVEVCLPNGERAQKGQGLIEMPINFQRNLPIYALVENGWLPPPFVTPPAYLPDRNIIGYIQQINKGNPHALYADTEWWLKIISDDQIHINPFLYAFESNQQRIPTFEEFKNSFAEAEGIIRGLFPNANLVVYGDREFNAAFDTIIDVLKFHPQETIFLQKVAPLIRECVPKDRLQQVCDDIFQIAERLGLPLTSIPLLAALSCLYEDRNIAGYNAARELLHLKGGVYTDEKAYNALSDMRGLLLYLAFRAIAYRMNANPYAYCTADKAALLFGCGLGFKNVEFRGNQLYLALELSEFLFPRLAEDKRRELAERIMQN